MAYVQKRMTDQDEQNGLTRQGSGLTQSSSSAVSPQSGQPSTKAPQDFTRTGFNTTAKILDRNQGANTAAVENRLLAPVTEQVAGEKNRIQGIGTDYENTQKAKLAPQYNPIDQSTLQAATRGGDAFASVQKILGQKGPQKIDTVEKPAVSQIPLTQFANNREFAPLLNQTSKGPYTRGMGALDMASLARSGTPQALQQRVGQFQGELNDAATGLQANQNNVQTFANEAADTQRNQIIQALQGLKGDVLGQSGKTVAERKAESEAKIQQEKEKARTDYLGQIEAQLGLRKGQLSEQEKQFGQGNEGKFNDARNELDVISARAREKAADESFLGQARQGNFGSGIDTEKALQLNNIATLLGENPNVSGDTGVDQGGFSYDPKNFESFLGDLFNKDPNLQGKQATISGLKDKVLAKQANESFQKGKLPIPGNEGGVTGQGRYPGPQQKKTPAQQLIDRLTKGVKFDRTPVASAVASALSKPAATPLPIRGNEGGAVGPVPTSTAPQQAQSIVEQILNAPQALNEGAEKLASKLDPRKWRL